MSTVNYDEVQKLIAEEIGNTLKQVKKEDVEKLLEGIQKAEKVFFVGVGRINRRNK